MKYELVIFDWDGCLARTLEVWLEGYGRVFAEYGQPQRDKTITGIFGDWHGPSRLGIADEVEFFGKVYAYIDEAIQQVALYPGARDLVAEVHKQGGMVAILTSTTREQLMPNLKRLGLVELVNMVVTGEEVEKQKPDPEGVDTILGELGVSQDKAVMIGDNRADVLAGRNAGVDTVLFYPPDHELFYEKAEVLESKPTYVVEGYGEMGGVLGIE
jgi:pyrophosphatase PpaX